MDLDKDFPFTTKEGHEYLVKFSQLNPDVIPHEMTIPVVDVTIELVISSDQTNNAKTLFQIADCIRNYVELHNVILYCYCDSAPIQKRNPDLLNQAYRSQLFVKMFEKQNNQDYINEKIIIEDPVNGNHYIHLFSKKQNILAIESIANELMRLNK